eukprot:12939272-Prorocentrum_lima.AAC.3
MHFHGAYFSNYSAWLTNPTAIKPSAQVVWPIVGQEVLNGDVGGNFSGVQITSGFFQLWRAEGVAPQEIPLPHEFLINRTLMAQLYPSFEKGLAPFFSFNWSEYSDFLTFKGGLNPVTGGLWLSDTAHHHLALAVLFLFAGHMYRTNFGIGHSIKEILEAHKGPFTGEGHKGAAAHGAIFMVRDYDPKMNYNNLLDRLHSFGLYIHNDTMRALGRPQDMFSDTAIPLQPVFAKAVQNFHLLAPGTTAPNALTTASYAFGGDTVSVDKANLGFRFPCDGPGRGDVWGTVGPNGAISHITSGNFAKSAITINGWLRDFLWSQASQVIQSYGSALSAYGLIFLGAHFIWAFSLMFLFSGRGYWQELIESVVWAHNKLKVAPTIQPRALSITQGRAVGLAHYLLGGIGTTWAFFLARSISVG